MLVELRQWSRKQILVIFRRPDSTAIRLGLTAAVQSCYQCGQPICQYTTNTTDRSATEPTYLIHSASKNLVMPEICKAPRVKFKRPALILQCLYAYCTAIIKSLLLQWIPYLLQSRNWIFGSYFMNVRLLAGKKWRATEATYVRHYVRNVRC